MAHCPVPVFLLFDSTAMLTRQDCKFPDRGLGSHNYQIGSSAQDLEDLRWKEIYHTGSIPLSESRHDIPARRNAEIIIPKRLVLEALRYIYCRSNAEKDTVLHLLSPRIRQQYQGKIVASTRSNLFFRKRTFIESATLLAKSIRLHFSPDTEAPGPFHLRIQIKLAGSKEIKEDHHFEFGGKYDCSLSLPRRTSQYDIRISLDGHLAFASSYEEMDRPF